MLEEKFDYAGNSSEDELILRHAEKAYLVNPTRRLLSCHTNNPIPSVNKIFKSDHSVYLLWLKQIRIHQWLKNILLFVPLLVSGLYFNPFFFTLSVLGFFSLSFLASSTYIINDLLDLNSDRAHIRKKFRPIANGSISIKDSLSIALLLFVSAYGIAIFININFFIALTAYLFLTLLYSFKETLINSPYMR